MKILRIIFLGFVLIIGCSKSNEDTGYEPTYTIEDNIAFNEDVEIDLCSLGYGDYWTFGVGSWWHYASDYYQRPLVVDKSEERLVKCTLKRVFNFKNYFKVGNVFYHGCEQNLYRIEQYPYVDGSFMEFLCLDGTKSEGEKWNDTIALTLHPTVSDALLINRYRVVYKRGDEIRISESPKIIDDGTAPKVFRKSFTYKKGVGITSAHVNLDQSYYRLDELLRHSIRK